MAINFLNNSLNSIQGSQTQAEGNAAAVQSGQSVRQAAMALLNELRDIMPGDTLSGQLVSKDGNSIQLMLNNNTLLNTNLDQDVNIGLGKQISFEVKSNHNGQLTLRPMFTNLSNSNTIMSALNAAGIAASDDTIAMVDNLMKNSMPINKDMLLTINQEMTMYPDASAEDLVMLHKMEIPVTDANIRQIELYKGNNQWMLENIEDSAAELSDMLLNMVAGDEDNAQTVIDGLKELLPPASDDASDDKQIGNGIKEEQTYVKEALPEGREVKADISVRNEEGLLKAELPDKPVLENENKTATGPEINKYNIFDKLSTLDKEVLKQPQIREAVTKAVNELLKDSFLMNPKDIAEEKFVKKYYERTMDLSEQLSRLLSENGKGETDFAKTVTNVKENTNFMNQINELYNYVQLPLKMNDSQANGDLYVYARKKGRGSGGEDGKLTALLHLSMEHLGNMDIFLTLQDGQNLSTKFTLEKEEMIDFIESHIDELNNRLIKKGYNLGTTSVEKQDDVEHNTIENIVKGDGGNIVLSTQSFDARA